MTQVTRFDTAALNKALVGFDRLFDTFETRFASQLSTNYPPHNIIKTDETHYQIEVAVAGFAENELDVELKDALLTVKGQQESKGNEITYLHKGIGTRNFVRTFPLAEHVEVRGATVKNGILTVDLELIVPEEKQSKKIAITFQK